jgi:hypothetical protein
VLAELLRQEPEEPEEPVGGEAACYAHLVCPECGAVVSEGHAQGCGQARLRRGVHHQRAAAAKPDRLGDRLVLVPAEDL